MADMVSDAAAAETAAVLGVLRTTLPTGFVSHISLILHNQQLLSTPALDKQSSLLYHFS